MKELKKLSKLGYSLGGMLPPRMCRPTMENTIMNRSVSIAIAANELIELSSTSPIFRSDSMYLKTLKRRSTRNDFRMRSALKDLMALTEPECCSASSTCSHESTVAEFGERGTCKRAVLAVSSGQYFEHGQTSQVYKLLRQEVPCSLQRQTSRSH
jgi:hypothetical protein